MTIIEILLPDGSIRTHTTVEQSYTGIDEEVARLFPDASHWRLSKDWRSVTGENEPSVLAVTWAHAKPVAVVLALAILLTPIVTWVTTWTGGEIAIFGPLRDSFSTANVDADELDAYPPAEPASVVRDVHIIGIDEQSSDTSRTLRVHLRNDGAQTHNNVRVQAIFYDSFDTLLPQAEGNVGTITLTPQQDGYVKVWAQSEYGVGQFELEILDPAP